MLNLITHVPVLEFSVQKQVLSLRHQTVATHSVYWQTSVLRTEGDVGLPVINLDALT